MTLADRLRDMAEADPETDLLAFLGVRSDQLAWDRETLSVGAESISVEEARELLRPPRRFPSLKIEDL